MFEASGNRPRLIVVGAEVDRANEAVLAKLVRSFEPCLIGETFSTWSARYAETHRALSYLERGALLKAVIDLMGEVPFSGVISLDARVDENLSWVSQRLGLVDTTGPEPTGPVLVSEPFAVLEHQDGQVIDAHRVPPGPGRAERIWFDLPAQSNLPNGVLAWRAGADEPFLTGLSPLLRSGLLTVLPDQDLADIAAAAFDPPSRALLRWIEPAA